MKIQLFLSPGNMFYLVFNSQVSQYDGSWIVIRIEDLEHIACFL